MMRISKIQIALIATGASILTSAMHGSLQAIFSSNFDSIENILAFVFGRVIGDLPLAIICFGLSYAISTTFKIQSDPPKQ